MQSSATPENSADLAMGLAINGGEGLAMVDTEVVACAGGGGAVRTRRRLSTSSWNESNRLMLNHSVGGPIFCYGK